MDRSAAPGPDGFVLVGVKGCQLRRSNFSKTWANALAKAGLPAEVHVHDLRHTEIPSRPSVIVVDDVRHPAGLQSAIEGAGATGYGHELTEGSVWTATAGLASIVPAWPTG